MNLWTVWFDFDLPHIFVNAPHHRWIYVAYIHRWHSLTNEYIGDESYRFHFPFALTRCVAHISHLPFPSRRSPLARSSPQLGRGIPAGPTLTAGRPAKLHQGFFFFLINVFRLFRIVFCIFRFSIGVVFSIFTFSIGVVFRLFRLIMLILFS
jgi:hypothetical protein